MFDFPLLSDCEKIFVPPDYLMRVFFPVVVEKQWDLCLDFILSPLRPSLFFVKVSRLILGADAVPGGIGSVWGAGNLSERFRNKASLGLISDSHSLQDM